MSTNQKVALITGAARRVGAEIAYTLHAAGMNVVLHYNHSQAEAEQLAQQLNALRANSVLTLQADLTEAALLENLIKAAAAEWGRLDVLVNNASRFYRTKIGEVTEATWQDLLDSNLKAPFFLCQAAANYLREHHGCIVNITDVHAERPMQDYPVYCIAKAGLVMLTQTLAKELAPSVRVNAVAPGTVALPEGENTLDAATKEKILSRVSLQRHGTAQDVAKAVLFLVQDAEYVTGQTIVVDGGRSLSI
nr:short chain dehydrogenase [uncultured bacterium]